MSGYGQWLLANPNPALVGKVAAPGCGMANLLSRQLQGLLGDRASAVPKPPVFGPVTGPSAVTGASAPLPGDRVILDVVASRPAEPVIGRSGKVLGQIAALPATALEITLDRGSDGRWRFCTVNAVADTGDPEDPSVPLL
ncbi:hypothetical protein ACPCHT_07485 [Nucisporomicrobium flavum]|uniref:hypothetical protein n=1 Tax=Nucisporomicrobium flavum TaxID=2785915 RepID=UPI003C2E7AFA